MAGVRFCFNFATPEKENPEVTNILRCKIVYRAYYISEREQGKYNLGTCVVNICYGHECNILFITVELLN